MSEPLPVFAAIFKGGGYDGCFWEWNAILTHPDHSLMFAQNRISGRIGKEMLSTANIVGIEIAISEEKGDTFWVRTQDDIDQFTKEFNAGFALKVLSAMHEAAPLEKRNAITMLCECCKKRFTPADIYHTKYSGAGGLAIAYHDNVCYECAELQHDKWIAEFEWPRMKKKERVEAIQKANADGADIDLSEADNDKCPISGRYVYEMELY